MVDDNDELTWKRTYLKVFALGIVFILLFWWFTATFNLP